MIGLDTNVVVRYLMQDDDRQAVLANAVIEALSAANPGYLSVVVLVEIVWVLKRAYGLERADIAELIDGLLTARELVVEARGEALQALITYRQSRADFSDCLIERLAHRAGCASIVTFDKTAARQAGMSLLSEG